MGNRVLSYNKLWKLLIDRNIKKKDLSQSANVSSTSLAKLKHGDNVNTDVLIRICNTLNCDISDIAEMVVVENVSMERDNND